MMKLKNGKKKKNQAKVHNKVFRLYGDVHSEVVGYAIEDDAVLYVYFIDNMVYVIEAHVVGADRFMLCCNAAENGYGLSYLATSNCSRMYEDDGREALAFFDFLRHGGGN